MNTYSFSPSGKKPGATRGGKPSKLINPVGTGLGVMTGVAVGAGVTGKSPAWKVKGFSLVPLPAKLLTRLTSSRITGRTPMRGASAVI